MSLDGNDKLSRKILKARIFEILILQHLREGNTVLTTVTRSYDRLPSALLGVLKGKPS